MRTVSRRAFLGLSGVAGLGALAYLAPSTDSIADIGPSLQALYDAGVRTVELDSRGSYLIDTPVFLDAPDIHRRFVINANQATITLGDGGATTKAFTPDPRTKFGFWVNVKRSALSRGVVTATDATVASGNTAKIAPAFLIRDADIRLGTPNAPANRMVAFANRASVHLENCAISFGRGGISGRGYNDMMTVTGCKMVNPYGTDAALLWQIDNGDAVYVRGIAASAAYLVNLTRCNGAVVDAPVGGSIKLTDSHSVVINSPHIEGDEKPRNAAPIAVTRSHVTVVRGEFYAVGSDEPFPTVLVDDGTIKEDVFTDLELQGTVFRSMYRGAPDEQQGPDIGIAALNPAGRVRCRDAWAASQVIGVQDVWRQGLWVTSPDPQIQAALDAGAGLIAEGTWELRQTNGAWEVVHPERPGLIYSRGLAYAPAWTDVRVMPLVPGTLAPGTVYRYQAAIIDDFGEASPVSTTQSATAGRSGATSIQADLPGAGTLSVWRSEGQDGPPSAFVRIGVQGPTIRLLDTGMNINRRPWLTTGIPPLAGFGTSKPRMEIGNGQANPSNLGGPNA